MDTKNAIKNNMPSIMQSTFPAFINLFLLTLLLRIATNILPPSKGYIGSKLNTITIRLHTTKAFE